jgi:formylglycine-generating enzyme required for sulfatase activity
LNINPATARSAWSLVRAADPTERDCRPAVGLLESRRLLLGVGGVLGLALGLALAWYWEHPASLTAWALLLAGLGWAGADVRPRQIGTIGPPTAPVGPHGRRVRDGPLVMVELAGGTFLMGSPDTDPMADDREKPQHQVQVSALRMGLTPVTRGQWRAVIGDDRGPGGDAPPVTEVSWDDALHFCNRLSKQQGYRPCYRRPWYRQTGLWHRRHWVCDWQAGGYRLPTEAEWEYGCRAGTGTRWSGGDDPESLGDDAWFDQNSGYSAHPVAEKRPNPWGLHDLHGNVWEWCWDWYGPYRPDDPIDPCGAAHGQQRVVRGGAFFDSPDDLRSARRVYAQPEDRDPDLGFRCVRGPVRQP